MSGFYLGEYGTASYLNPTRMIQASEVERIREKRLKKKESCQAALFTEGWAEAEQRLTHAPPVH